MLRVVASIIGGLLAAFAIVFAADSLFHALTPVAEPDTNDATALAAYVAAQPIGLMVAMVVGWALAAFVGAFVAARFARRGPWPGWTVGGLFLLATLANFMMLTHPVWMVAASIVLVAAAAYLGANGGAGPSARRAPIPA